jgi:hypothetical protein
MEDRSYEIARLILFNHHLLVMYQPFTKHICFPLWQLVGNRDGKYCLEKGLTLPECTDNNTVPQYATFRKTLYHDFLAQLA